jgi:hypothetical protein
LTGDDFLDLLLADTELRAELSSGLSRMTSGVLSVAISARSFLADAGSEISLVDDFNIKFFYDVTDVG